MKVGVIILIICASQTLASFFEEFQGAMFSVQDSFGKLITDVYTDVSQTIGCTILAVKQVLALDKSFHESSDYNRRCRDQVPTVSQQVPRIDKKNMAYSYIENINANHELDNIEMEFKTETDRLMAISALLKREVDNIPKDLKFNFRFESDPQEPIGSIWQSLKILHDVEHNNKNYARSSEIHQVLDETLNIMNIKTTDVNESDDDKIESIVKDLEKDSRDQLIEAEEQLEEWKEEEFKEDIEIEALNKMNKNTTDTVKNLESDTKYALIKANKQFDDWKDKEIKDIETELLNKININTTDAKESDVNKIQTVLKDLESNAKEEINKADEQFEERKEAELKEFGIKALNKINTDNDVDKIKTYVKDLEKDTNERFKQWKEEKLKKEVEIKRVVNNDQQIDSLKNTTYNISENAKNIEFSQVTKSTELEKRDTSTKSPAEITTLSPELEAFQNYILTQYGPKDSDSKNAAVEEAARLIKDSELRNKVFDSFARAESASTDLFENPDLFLNNFGQN